LILLGIDD